jgi:3-hydroxy acid dehydrogenase/malonic semialdehyde reductase
MNWALVTGASSGIGHATAIKLAESGYSVFLLARRQDRLLKLSQSLATKYPKQKFEAVALDVNDFESMKLFVEKKSADLDNLDILINNAGLAVGTAKVQDLKPSDTAQMLQTNVKALIDITSLLIPKMIKNKKGFVVNLGSVAGRWVYPGGAVYCATKFAVRAFSEGLRQDVHGTGIRVANIEPGMVETEFSNVRFADEQKAKQVYAGMKPLTADDIAETILWVIKQPKHVNIQEVVIYPTDQSAIGMVERRT